MSEIFDYWKEQAEEERERKASSREYNILLFENLYNRDDHDYLVEKRTDYHFSLYLNGMRVDYYPTSGKARNVTLNGKYIVTEHPEELQNLFLKND